MVPTSHGGPGALRGPDEIGGAFCAKRTNALVGVAALRGRPGAGRRARLGWVCSPLRLSDKRRGRGGTDARSIGRRAASGRERRPFLHESDECRGDANWRDKAGPAGGGLPGNGTFVRTEGAESATAVEARGRAPLLRFPAPPPLASHLLDARLRSRRKAWNIIL
ncbi:hypothetical protein GCM10009416_00880 [Craurococcus roseus]|uniref:Uncharacterized protein n=1 Tax=Craurococcus roseus TaxID=77585 RepID=A0ABP3PIT7_9PROT